jgi:hypothetical protein
MPTRGSITLRDATANSFKPPAPVGDYSGMSWAPWNFAMPQYQLTSAPAIADTDRRFDLPGQMEACVTCGRMRAA